MYAQPEESLVYIGINVSIGVVVVKCFNGWILRKIIVKTISVALILK